MIDETFVNFFILEIGMTDIYDWYTHKKILRNKMTLYEIASS